MAHITSLTFVLDFICNKFQLDFMRDAFYITSEI